MTEEIKTRKLILKRSNEALSLKMKLSKLDKGRADLQADIAIVEKDILNMQLRLDELRWPKK
jgi:hypothetical protein